MANAAPAKTATVDLIFRAFSDRTRLRILHLIQGSECCVGNVVEILGIEQPSASRHLAYLRRAGLVSVRRAGLWCYYSLAPAKAPFHQKLLECLACCFSEVPELRADQARSKRLREAGGCCPGEEKAPATNPKKGGTSDDECCPVGVNTPTLPGESATGILANYPALAFTTIQPPPGGPLKEAKNAYHRQGF